jgi:hypothetical protein
MNARRILIILFLIVAMGFFVACGEEATEAGPGDNDVNAVDNDDNGDNQNNDTRPTGPEDCEDHEIFNPALGECVEVGNNDEEPDENDPNENQNNDDPGEECEDDEVWDEVEEECIEVEPAECGPGHLVGSACRPDGANLGGAHVLLEGVDCEGEYFSMETTADPEGEYSFSNIPSGTHELTVSSGSFEGTEEVDIFKGATRDLTSDSAKICLQGESVNIAVVSGSFDDIAGILTDMQIPFDLQSTPSSFFADMDDLRYYDIIFVECGATWPGGAGDSPDISANIRQYIEEGHSLYASDLAFRFVDFPFGDAFQFSSSTASSQTIQADVVSTDMQTLLGSTTTEVIFNLPGVRVVEQPGPTTEIQFEGDVSGVGDDMPLMSIYYDLVGGGRAVYTSFHNSAQATGDMQDILEFMIFQL